MRQLLRILCLCVLLASAGCTALGPGSVDEGALETEVQYDWNTSADATIDLQSGRYVAVYRLEATESVELYQPRRLNDREPVDPIGPAFRFPNGTVVNVTGESVSREGGATVIDLPAPNGSLGYAASRNGKSIRLPRTVNGSYEVVLPPGGRVEYPLLGRVIPGGYETVTGPDDRVRIQWDRPDRDRIAVEYYLARDLLILAGIVGAGTIALLLGATHYVVSIKRLRRRREDVDVEYDD